MACFRLTQKGVRTVVMVPFLGLCTFLSKHGTPIDHAKPQETRARLRLFLRNLRKDRVAISDGSGDLGDRLRIFWCVCNRFVGLNNFVDRLICQVFTPNPL